MSKFMKTAALTFYFSSVFATDLPITSDFEVSAQGKTMRFRHVDLFTLQGQDLAKFQSMTEDYDMQKMAFGSVVADALYAMSWFQSKPGHSSYMSKKAEFRETIPEYYTHEWFIEDMSQNGSFVGTVSLSKPKYFPDGYTAEDSVLFAVSLHKDYRGKKQVKKFGPQLMDVIKGFTELRGKTLVILSLPGSPVVRNVAQSLGFRDLGISRIYVDYLRGVGFNTNFQGYGLKL